MATEVLVCYTHGEGNRFGFGNCQFTMKKHKKPTASDLKDFVKQIEETPDKKNGVVAKNVIITNIIYLGSGK